MSPIGSVAERSEIPSDFRCARSAKWSYFSREARQVEDDYELNPALVRATVLQELASDVLVGKAIGFVGQLLATPLDRSGVFQRGQRASANSALRAAAVKTRSAAYAASERATRP